MLSYVLQILKNQMSKCQPTWI